MEEPEEPEEPQLFLDPSNTPVSQYQYTPLGPENDAIRLLRFLPALLFSAPVCCELINTSITRSCGKLRRGYIAGSYVWGAATPLFALRVDNGVLPVRDNLLHFLRAVRSKYRTEMLWLDALCINQNSVQERNHQVSMMGDIYRNAKCVYCWLGTRKADIISLFHRVQQAQFGPKTMQTVLWNKDEQVLHELRILAQAEYWTRVWIVQEFVLAREVWLLCGGERIKFQGLDALLDTKTEAKLKLTLEQKLTSRTTLALNAKNPMSSRMLQMRRCRRDKETRDLEGLFEAFGAMPCSMKQDRVYALLGLVQGLDDGEVKNLVDYEQSCWKLLRTLLETHNLRSPAQLTERYATYVLMDEQDGVQMSVPLAMDRDVFVTLPAGCDPRILYPNPGSGPTDETPKAIHQLLAVNERLFGTDTEKAPTTGTPNGIPSWRGIVIYALHTPKTQNKHTSSSILLPLSHTRHSHAPTSTTIQTSLIISSSAPHHILGLALSQPRPSGDNTNHAPRSASPSLTLDELRNEFLKYNDSLLHKRLMQDVLPKALAELIASTSVQNVAPTRYRLCFSRMEVWVRLASVVAQLEEAHVLQYT